MCTTRRTRADSLECDRCKESDTVEWGVQAHNILPPTRLVLLPTMQLDAVLVEEASHARDRAHDERQGGRTGQIYDYHVQAVDQFCGGWE